MWLSGHAIQFGERNENMCGYGFIEMLKETLASPQLRSAFVRFDYGAYTKWHYHTGEQMLLIVEGEGFVECEDRPTLKVNPGARIYIPAGVRHGHGAQKGMNIHLLAGDEDS
jgi:quercetin dioxygenase-like cupin family protein